MNLVDLIEKFRSEDKCRAYLERLRWPEGVCCPRCGDTTISRIKDRGQFDCDGCRYQFSVTSGTIMHDTKLPLWKWFLAVYMMVEAKKGVSANQLKRTLGVSYRTAWYLCHRIRKALETPDALLSGVIEIDETFIGGRTKREDGSHLENKVAIIGAVQRGGEARLKVRENRTDKDDRPGVGKFLRANIAQDAVLYTDDAPVMRRQAAEHGAAGHDSVVHSKDQWVKGDVHTNGVEGVWSLFKRSVIGSYHQVSVKHLPAYLEEFEFRFNNRNNPFIFRDAMVCLMRAESIEYDTLVS